MPKKPPRKRLSKHKGVDFGGISPATWGQESPDIPPMPPQEEWGDKKEFALHLLNGKARCQAWSRNALRAGKRSADAQCPKTAQEASHYCYYHHKRFVPKPKTVQQEFSRYKKHIPQHFLKRFAEAASDPAKLSLIEELDLITARLGEILERVDTRQSDMAWKMVEDAYNVIRQAIKSGDAQGVTTGVSMLRQAIRRSDYPTWHEIINLVQQRRTLVESERRRVVEQAEVISVMEMMGVVVRIQEIIHEVVIDEDQKASIAEKFRALVAPDVMVLPSKTGDPHHVPRPDKRTAPKVKGCYLCRHDFFRKRNAAGDGTYVCPECQSEWSAEENKVEVVDGKTNAGGPGNSKGNVVRFEHDAQTEDSTTQTNPVGEAGVGGDGGRGPTGTEKPKTKTRKVKSVK